MAEPAGDPRRAQMLAVQQNNSELRYVGWMLTAFLHLVSLFVSTYKKVRDGSGPLKFGFHFVENIFTFFFGLDLIIHFLSHLTFVVLKFIDGRVKWIDEKFLPKSFHDAGECAYVVLQNYPFKSEIEQVGLIKALDNLSEKFYADMDAHHKGQFRFEFGLLVQAMVTKWKRLNEFKLFRKLAQVFVPMVRYCCVKYNECLVFCQENGYKGFGYLPLIPVEKISQTFAIAQ